MPLFYGMDPGVFCLSLWSWILWLLGYPDQALKRSHEALTLAQQLSHPFSLAIALQNSAAFHQFRREAQAAQEQAEAAISTLDRAGVSGYVSARTTLCRAGRWPSKDREKKASAQIRQGLAALRATGSRALPAVVSCSCWPRRMGK